MGFLFELPWFLSVYISVATQAERDSFKFLEQQTRTRVALSCVDELEREVDDILGPIGVPSDLSRQVTNALLHEESIENEEQGPSHSAESSLESGATLKFQSSIGLTPFLLQFGQGVEPIPKIRMYSSAATIGLGYLVGGFIPLLPYFFIRETFSFRLIIYSPLNWDIVAVVNQALLASCVVTFLVLILFGILKAHITGAGNGKHRF